MSRFWSSGDELRVNVTTGRLNIGTGGAGDNGFTLAAIIKRAQNAVYHSIINYHNAGGSGDFPRMEITDGSNYLEIGSAGPTQNSSVIGMDVLVADGWVLIAVTKASGTSTPRFHKYVFSTNTWTHGNAAGTLAANTATGATGTIRFGKYQTADNFNGSIEIAGVFDRALTDGELETLPHNVLAWINQDPAGLYVFNTASPLAEPTNGTPAKTYNIVENGSTLSKDNGTNTTDPDNNVCPWFNWGGDVIEVTRQAAGGATTANAAVATASAAAPDATTQYGALAAAAVATATAAAPSPTTAIGAVASAGLATASAAAPDATATHGSVANAAAATATAAAPDATATHGVVAPAAVCTATAAAPDASTASAGNVTAAAAVCTASAAAKDVSATYGTVASAAPATASAAAPDATATHGLIAPAGLGTATATAPSFSTVIGIAAAAALATGSAQAYPPTTKYGVVAGAAVCQATAICYAIAGTSPIVVSMTTPRRASYIPVLTRRASYTPGVTAPASYIPHVTKRAVQE